jgi:polyisoprenoid-binding protein YceI
MLFSLLVGAGFLSAKAGTPTAGEEGGGPVAVKNGKVSLTGKNSQILFTGTKKGGKHDCGFSTFTGTLELNDKGDAPKALSLEIDIKSLFTDEKSGKLNRHLLSKDFFDAAKFPKATFESEKIAPGKDGAHDVVGKLTLHGESKEITFPIKVTIANETLKGESTFQIDRQDFGVSFGKGLVNDQVTINVKVGVAGK